MEERKDIVGYEGLYKVSSLGRVRSVDRIDSAGRRLTGKIISQHLCGPNLSYSFVGLSNRGHTSPLSVHRIVAIAFLGMKDGLEVNHINGIKTDNSISNLERVTKSEQHLHRYHILGKKFPKMIMKLGKDNPGSKKVNQYDRNGNLIQEWIGIRDIQRKLSINQSSITKVCKGNAKSAGGFIWRYS